MTPLRTLASMMSYDLSSALSAMVAVPYWPQSPSRRRNHRKVLHYRLILRDLPLWKPRRTLFGSSLQRCCQSGLHPMSACVKSTESCCRKLKALSLSM